jgi:hypothetical protein
MRREVYGGFSVGTASGVSPSAEHPGPVLFDGMEFMRLPQFPSAEIVE